MFDVEIGLPLSLHGERAVRDDPAGRVDAAAGAPLATDTRYVEAPGTGDQRQDRGIG